MAHSKREEIGGQPKDKTFWTETGDTLAEVEYDENGEAKAYKSTSRDFTKPKRKLTVDIDTSDAVTSLKALQRHARETTKVLREVESEQPYGSKAEDLYFEPYGWDGGVIRDKAINDQGVLYFRLPEPNLGRVSTQELADELAQRATRENSVNNDYIGPSGQAKLERQATVLAGTYTDEIDGPAQIIVVKRGDSDE